MQGKGVACKEWAETFKICHLEVMGKQEGRAPLSPKGVKEEE